MSYRKLQRTSSQRKALLRDLTTNLIVNGRIETTEARAKEVRRTAEQMVTLGKRGDLHARRQAASFIRNVVADVKEEDDNIRVQSALQSHLSLLIAMVDTHVCIRQCLVAVMPHRWLF